MLVCASNNRECTLIINDGRSLKEVRVYIDYKVNMNAGLSLRGVCTSIVNGGLSLQGVCTYIDCKCWSVSSESGVVQCTLIIKRATFAIYKITACWVPTRLGAILVDICESSVEILENYYT